MLAYIQKTYCTSGCVLLPTQYILIIIVTPIGVSFLKGIAENFTFQLHNVTF